MKYVVMGGLPTINGVYSDKYVMAAKVAPYITERDKLAIKNNILELNIEPCNSYFALIGSNFDIYVTQDRN